MAMREERTEEKARIPVAGCEEALAVLSYRTGRRCGRTG